MKREDPQTSALQVVHTSQPHGQDHHVVDAANQIQLLPTFAESEFETIIRRQRPIAAHGLKVTRDHVIRSHHLDANWQFAGWGSTQYMEIIPEDLAASETELSKPRTSSLGQFKATSISGNGVYSSVFYALPSVAATSSIYAPISLVLACLLLFPFRLILLELGSTVRLNGANYIYMLQFSGKTMATVAAAVTLFDALCASTVSAASASAYLGGQFTHLPVKEPVISICLIALLALIALLGTRESSNLALSFSLLHLSTMLVLAIVSIIALAQHGSPYIAQAWSERPRGARYIAKAIFDGVSLGFLATTGIECTPAYIEDIHPQIYDQVLRNLLFGALLLNGPLMLLAYCLVPSSQISGGNGNVLSELGQNAGGSWLRILVVVDAVLVLAGGIFTGLFTVCGLIDRLARDRVMPQIFLRLFPITNSPYSSVILFVILAIVVYASSAFSLFTISSIYSIVYIITMSLYAVSSLFLHFERGPLKRNHRTSSLISSLCLVITLVVLVGNIIPNPSNFGICIAYLVGVYICVAFPLYEVRILKLLVGFSEQSKVLRRWRWDQACIKRIKTIQRFPVYVWVKSDDIHSLLKACTYVATNESTSRMVFIHAYNQTHNIPSELEANCKILDEAFPAITLDLVFLKGQFSSALTHAVSVKLNAPLSSSFMFTPGKRSDHEIADFGGMRMIG